MPVNPATFRVGVLHASNDTSIRGCREALSQIRRVMTSFIYISARVAVVISLRAINRRLQVVSEDAPEVWTGDRAAIRTARSGECVRGGSLGQGP